MKHFSNVILVFLMPLFIVNPLFSQNHGMGLIPEDLSDIPWIFEYKEISVRDAIPPQMINTRYLPPVKNQTTSNACIGFSIGYYYKTYQEAKEKKWDVNSISNQCSPAFVYNHINGGSDGGAQFSDAWKVLQDHGCAMWADMPFDPSKITEWPSESAYLNGLDQRIETIFYIDCSDDSGLLTLKEHLADSSLAVIGIHVYENFWHENIVNFDTVYCVNDVSGDLLGNHAITLIGYDDNRVTNDGIGAFRLVNSYGDGWGNNGFAWISYEAVKNSITCNQQASFATDKIDYSPSLIVRAKLNHQHSRSVSIRYGIGSDTAPDFSKEFFNWTKDPVNNIAFPESNIVFDLSDGLGVLQTNTGNNIFLRTIDNINDGEDGAVELFTADQLNWGTTSTTFDAPNNIPDYNIAIFTELTLYSDISTYLIDSDIVEDVAWGGYGNQYYIPTEIKVYNATLTINEGAKVLFNTGAGLRVSYGNYGGALIGSGTESNPIYFTSSSGSNNDWTGIIFDDRSDYSGYSSSLTNCIIEKAGQNNVYDIPAEVYCRLTNGVTISECTIGLAISEPARGVYSLYCIQSSPLISNSTINNSGGNALIYLNDNSSPGINDNEFFASGNPYWIYADNANCGPTVSGNIFDGLVTQSIRVGPNSVITGNHFSGTFSPGMEIIAGQMSESRTWSKQTGDSVYVVVAGSDNDIRVFKYGGSPILTIDPGVVVKFDGTGIRLGPPGSYTYPGGLEVNGTESEPVLMTSLSGSRGGWRGIIFDEDSDYNMNSSLSWCMIENAGMANHYSIPAAVYIYNATDVVTMTHCTISGSDGHSLYLQSSSASYTGGIISQASAEPAVMLNAGTLTLSQNTISSNFDGTEAVIRLENSSAGTFSNNAVYSTGGAYWLKCLDAGSSLDVLGNSFSGTVTHPLRVGPNSTITGNTISGTFTPGMEIIAGQMSESRTWSKQTGDSVYVVVAGSDNDIRVFKYGGSPILTIDPGVVVKFDGTGIRLGPPGAYSYPGGLMVNGTSSEPVLITSLSGSSAGWRGIIFDEDSDDGLSSVLSYCTIENAGMANHYNIPAAVNIYNATDVVSMDRCVIRNNGGLGIQAYNSSFNLVNSQVINNGSYGIYLDGNSNAVIGNGLGSCNDIYNNTGYALYNNTSNTISATYNYWGSIESNEIESMIYHQPDNGSLGQVLYNPWVDDRHQLVPSGPPSMPIPLVPITGTEIKPEDYLIWTESFDAYDSVFYHIQIDEDGDFLTPELDVFGITADSFFTSPEMKVPVTKMNQGINTVAVKISEIPGYNQLNDNTIYYWRVESYDDKDDYSGFSGQLCSFFYNPVNNAPNAVVSGFWPVDSNMVVDVNPVISWHAAIDADLSDAQNTLHYLLQIDDDEEFASNYMYQYTTEAGMNSFRVVDSLTDNTLWSYRVQTVDDEGLTSSWSEIQHFISNYPVDFNKTVMESWNLVGLPAKVGLPYYYEIFPSATTGTLYGYDGTYIELDSMELGTGYWLNFSTPDTFNIDGLKFRDVTIPMNNGWNLISGISRDVSLSEINDPDSIITPGTLYGFNGNYFSTDTIRQGTGYWLRASTEGEISMDFNSLGKSLNTDFPLDLSIFPQLLIQDASGAGQELYFEVESETAFEKECYSLPPIPPSGAFDARFVDGYRISETSASEILFKTSLYPVEIKFNNLFPEDRFGYQMVTLSGKQKLQVFDVKNGISFELYDPEITGFLIEKIEKVPVKFVVYQNYPNPFNPTTEIKYGIPKDSKVELSIYNALGQKVRTLISGNLKAGYHQVAWDGTNQSGIKLSSGIYFYRICADKHQTIKKMILLK